MIFSKNSLFVYKLLSDNDDSPIVKCALFCVDGMIIASNLNSIVFVEPLNAIFRNSFQFYNMSNNIFLKKNTIKQILNYIPKDTLLNGLSEIIDISISSNNSFAEISFFDEIKKFKKEFPCLYLDYNPLFSIIKELFTKYKPVEKNFTIDITRFYKLLHILKLITGANSKKETPILSSILYNPEESLYCLKCKSIISTTGQQVLLISWINGEYAIQDGLIERRFNLYAPL